MAFLEVKKHKGVYEINSFYSKTSKSHYSNIIDKDANKLSQIFIDLILEGFPVEKAYRLAMKRIKKRDWMGV